MKLFSSYEKEQGHCQSQGNTPPLDILEPRLLFTAVPLITEFLAPVTWGGGSTRRWHYAWGQVNRVVRSKPIE